MLRPVIRALCRQRLREIDHGSFEANYAAKMKWIEGIRAKSNIADVPHKPNEQHYEVRGKSIRDVCTPFQTQSAFSGFYGLYAILYGPLRQVLVLPLPHWEGNSGGGGGSHAGKLLREGSAEGWD